MSEVSAPPRIEPRVAPVNGIVQPPVVPPAMRVGRRTNQLAFLAKQLGVICRHRYAEPFLQPVDAEKYNIPTYHQIIDYPMDFQTIKLRLKNNYYWSGQEALDDFQLVFDNCFKFNQPDSEVYEMGQILKKYYLSKIAVIPKTEKELPKPVSKSSSKSSKHRSRSMGAKSKGKTSKKPVKRAKQQQEKHNSKDGPASKFACVVEEPMQQLVPQDVSNVHVNAFQSLSMHWASTQAAAVDALNATEKGAGEVRAEPQEQERLNANLDVSQTYQNNECVNIADIEPPALANDVQIQQHMQQYYIWNNPNEPQIREDIIIHQQQSFVQCSGPAALPVVWEANDYAVAAETRTFELKMIDLLNGMKVFRSNLLCLANVLPPLLKVNGKAKIHSMAEPKQLLSADGDATITNEKFLSLQQADDTVEQAMSSDNETCSAEQPGLQYQLLKYTPNLANESVPPQKAVAEHFQLGSDLSQHQKEFLVKTIEACTPEIKNTLSSYIAKMESKDCMSPPVEIETLQAETLWYLYNSAIQLIQHYSAADIDDDSSLSSFSSSSSPNDTS